MLLSPFLLYVKIEVVCCSVLFGSIFQIQRIVEGGEPSTFKQYFSGWRETEDQIGLGRVFALEQIAGVKPNLEVMMQDVMSLNNQAPSKSTIVGI